jgi:hypothetical protein
MNDATRATTRTLKSWIKLFDDVFEPTPTLRSLIDDERARVEAEWQARHDAEEARDPRDRMVDVLDHWIATRRAETDRWAEKFKKEPAYALEWASNIFQQSAELELYEKVRGWLLNEELRPTLHTVFRELERELRNRSKQSSYRSTSPTSNCVDDARRIAVAEMLDGLNSFDIRRLLMAESTWTQPLNSAEENALRALTSHAQHGELLLLTENERREQHDLVNALNELCARGVVVKVGENEYELNVVR